LAERAVLARAGRRVYNYVLLTKSDYEKGA
jgi:hypothetical protein